MIEARKFIVRVFSLTLLLTTFSTAAEANVTRYLTGDPADVTPKKLYGPALNLGGGGGDVDEAMQWLIDEVRGCTSCATKIDVVVLRASGADGYNEYIHAMRGVDSVETLVVTSAADSDKDEVAGAVAAAEVVFFAGGDQCNYVRNFRGTRVERAVESVYGRGGGVGGTSAGEAIQGEFVYDGCVESATSPQALADPYHKHVTFSYDFFRWPHMRGTITDQHLAARDRIGRTLAFVARQIRDGRAKKVLAVAVNEKTSVVVDRRGLARVVGEGPAYFILGDHGPEVCEPGQPLTYSNFKIWKAEKGRTFDLRRRPKAGYYTVSVDGGKLSRNPY